MENRINQIIELAEKLPKDDPKFDAMLKVVKEKQATQQQKIMIFFQKPIDKTARMYYCINRLIQ